MECEPQGPLSPVGLFRPREAVLQLGPTGRGTVSQTGVWLHSVVRTIWPGTLGRCSLLCPATVYAPPHSDAHAFDLVRLPGQIA